MNFFVSTLAAIISGRLTIVKNTPIVVMLIIVLGPVVLAFSNINQLKVINLPIAPAFLAISIGAIVNEVADIDIETI